MLCDVRLALGHQRELHLRALLVHPRLTRRLLPAEHQLYRHDFVGPWRVLLLRHLLRLLSEHHVH